jgi:hypothetical protein
MAASGQQDAMKERVAIVIIGIGGVGIVGTVDVPADLLPPSADVYLDCDSRETVSIFQPPLGLATSAFAVKRTTPGVHLIRHRESSVGPQPASPKWPNGADVDRSSFQAVSEVGEQAGFHAFAVVALPRRSLWPQGPSELHVPSWILVGTFLTQPSVYALTTVAVKQIFAAARLTFTD